MPMAKFLTIFGVTGTAGKLSIHKIIAAPNPGLAGRKMSRLITEHPSYKVGSKVEVSAIEAFTDNGECGDWDCCAPQVMHPDRVDVWIGTDRQIYDTGRTMEADYKKLLAHNEKRNEQERLDAEQDLANGSIDQETFNDLINKIYPDREAISA